MRAQPPIGRDEELSALVRFLAEMGRAAAGTVLEGDPGAGKTTLFDAALSSARDLDYRVLVCRPAQSEQSLSFAALQDVLDPVFDEVADELEPPKRHALAVALLREEPETRSPTAAGVAAAFLAVLRSLARRGPVLIGADDVHWLDAATGRVFDYAVRRIRDEPVGLIVTARIGEADELLGSFRRGLGDERFTDLKVGPLSLGAIHSLLKTRLQVTLSRPVLRRVYDTAGGNPFFALEIVRTLGPKVGSSGEPLPVPATLRDVIDGRLAALPAEARELLTIVAAMPRPTHASLLGLLEPATADARLAQAERAGILRVEGGRIRFVHPLLASRAYGQLTTTERRRLHARLAELAPSLEERARHLAVSADGPDETVARALEEAAGDASSRGAPIAAAELLETAARLTPESLPEQGSSRRLKAARAHFVAGDSEVASNILSSLLAGSSGRLRAEASVTLGRISYYTDDHPAARSFYEAAIVEPEAPRPVAYEAHEGLVWLLSREDIPASVRHAKAAADLARELGDDGALGEALATQGMAESLLGTRVALELIARGVEVARGRDYPRVIQSPEFAEAVALAWSDELTGARERFERLVARATERQDESSMVRLLLGVSQVHLLGGDWRAASQYAAEAAEAGELSGQHSQLKMLFFSKALVDAHLGLVESVRGSSASWDERDPMGDVAGGVDRVAHGLLELSLGRFDQAHRVLAPLVERMLASGIAEPAAVRFIPDDVEALIHLGRLDEAETVLRWYAARAKRTRRHSALAAAERCRGLLLASFGDLSGASSAFDRALAEHELVPMPFERARTLLATGATLRRAKQKRAAKETLSAALEVFERLGAPLWAKQAEAELARIGGRTRSVGLTPTESRIAELVAEGRSNKEVAATVFVAVKTVEATLSRIYAKLGIRSRTELARSLTLTNADGSSSRDPGGSGAGKV